jgi:ABC-type phosphate transport system substrate-binding protein
MSASGRAVILIIIIVISLALPRDQIAQAAPSTADARGNLSQSLAIVVNRSNPIDNLSFAELRKIFLGDRNHWSNGHRIAIAMLEYGQPERRAVLRLIYRMDEKAYQDYLLRGMFRGDVFVAPKTLTSPTIVRKFVFNAPGGIGYLRASDVDESVKVIRIDGLLPEDKGYRLQIDESSKGTDD